ncbi:hypothetical protein [Streptomyces sp. NBC_00467]
MLRKFISGRGKYRGRSVTRATAQRQRKPAVAIVNARETMLLPYVSR